MDILYLLIPLSAVLVLAILGLFGWAVQRGQFEDLDDEGQRILTMDDPPVDGGQANSTSTTRQSTVSRT